MKRGAEKQLSKDNAEDIGQEDELEPRRGFQKADENVLASREIRGLPKRSSTMSLASTAGDDRDNSTTPEVPAVPKFAGFGTPLPSSTSFTFTSSSPLPSTPAFGTPSTSTGSIFGSSAPKSSLPSVSPSASGATKAFASVLSSPSVPAASSSHKTQEVDPVALKYYSSLRGLNVSFLSAISKAVEQDPFTDVSDMVAHYKNFRISVQKEFDEKPKANATPSSSASSTFGAPAMPRSSTPKTSTAMPTPPTTFAGFGKGSGLSSSPTTSPAGSGFTPKVDSAAPAISGFSLPTPSTTPTASSNPAKSAFGSTTNVPDFFSSSKPSTDSAPKPASSFGTSPFSSSTSPFSTKSTAPASDASSLFGGGTFGSPSKLPAPDKEKEKEKDIKPESGPGASSSLFGSSTPPSNPFSISDKPATTSLFGASSNIFGSSGSSASTASATGAKPTSVFGGFGSGKSGTFGNPVGFGFGSALKTPEGDTPPPTTAAATATSVFGSKSGGFGGSTFGGFGAAPAKPAEASGSQGEEEETGSSAIAPSDVADDSKSLPTKSHDEEGEGEEDEETTHTTKSKVYKLHKKDDVQEWKDLGVGILRLKTHTTTGSRRVLLRNSSTGKVIINFNIYSGLNPSLTSKFITLVGHDEDGVSATYKLRTQSDQHAADLKNALDREIAFVKGKTE